MASRIEHIERIRRMAGMVLELRAAGLAKATAERDAVQEKLNALDRLPGEDALQDMAVAQSFFSYEGWAAGRRAKLQNALALKELVWSVELEETRRAFGRRQVLAKLQQEAESKARKDLAASRSR